MRIPSAAGVLFKPVRRVTTLPFVRPGARPPAAMGRARILASPAGATDAPEGHEFVFSYGSNSPSQLATRLRQGKAEPFVFYPAVLTDHVRVFAGHSKTWGGAVASVHPAGGQQVHGLVAQLTSDELEQLDTYEGAYTRSVQQFRQVDNGQFLKAWIYVKDDTTYHGPPSSAYLLAIHRMLSESGHACHIDVHYVSTHGAVVQTGTWAYDTGLVAMGVESTQQPHSSR